MSENPDVSVGGVAADDVSADVRWLDPVEEQAWRGFRRVMTLLPHRIERDLRTDSKLSAADYEVLSNLSESADRSYRLMDLADRLLWSRSRLSHQIERMERRGLIIRRSCGDDGRGAIAALTTEGVAAIEAAAPDHVTSVRTHFIDQLTRDELEMLAAMSERLVDRLE
ncbi:MAG: winged helix-turn-helix transcriptional regulator [Ilumatobacter sp.]|nr:winged helix-turn-helix transcriptional regulator [Ilumatobacter sp.]